MPATPAGDMIPPNPPRLLSLQTRHLASPDRETHGDPQYRHAGALRGFPGPQQAGDRPAVQGIVDRDDQLFRDPAVWEYLADVVLPELLARRTQEHMLRAWVIGCSTGEEAYSLAMVFTEARQRLRKTHDITLQIFASDLSPDAIATARRGRYPTSITANVSPERLAVFSTPTKRTTGSKRTFATW